MGHGLEERNGSLRHSRLKEGYEEREFVTIGEVFSLEWPITSALNGGQ